MHACPQSLSPLADSRVSDSLLQIISHFNEALLQRVDFTYTTAARLPRAYIVDGVDLYCLVGQRSGPMKSGISEVLWCASMPRRHQIPSGPVHIGDTAVIPVSVIRDLGVYIDCCVTMIECTRDRHRQSLFRGTPDDT